MTVLPINLFLLLIGVWFIDGKYKDNKHQKFADRLYVGSYNEPNDWGITTFEYQRDRFEEKSRLVTRNVNYLIMSKNERYIYSANELHGDTTNEIGKITAYAITDNGSLKPLNWLCALGSQPAYLTLDGSGKYLLSANHDSGKVVVMRVYTNNGSLDRIVHVQEAPHSEPNTTRAHMVEFHPTNPGIVAVVYLGLDRVYFYKFDNQNGRLSPFLVKRSRRHLHAQLEEGIGPRHFAFSHDGRFMYVIGQTVSTVTVFEAIFDDDFSSAALIGFKNLKTVSSLPADYWDGGYGAEIALHKSGNFLYASNRGHDSIAVFWVNKKTGLVTPIQFAPTGGRTPRHFILTPDGQQLIVANESSDSVVVFDINMEDGRLAYRYTITERVQQPAVLLYQQFVNYIPKRTPI